MSIAIAAPEEAAPALEHRSLGRYALRYRIADGGMASVYLAQLTTTEGFRKWVAVKTVHPDIAQSPRFVQMFLDEARLAARLDHPNVCSVFDFGESDGTWFLAMEYLHGESLASLHRRALKADGLPLEIAVRIIADAARGLHAAHELRTDDGRHAGVVHRDVSPQNVFVLYTGVAKVVDFGIARSEERTGELTRTGELKGKVAFMSPEQIDQAVVDRRTDVWALGVVLWECTVGRRLFKRESEARTMAAVLQDRVPRPSELCPDYPRELEDIVMRALDRRLDQRTPTALQLARSLEAFLAKSATQTGGDEVGEFVRRLFADKVEMREDLLKRDVAEHVIDVVVEEPSDSASLAPFELVRRRALPPAPAVLRSPRVLPVTGRLTAWARSKRPREPLSVALGLVLLVVGAVPGAYLATRSTNGVVHARSTPPAAERAPVVARPVTLVVAPRVVPIAALAAAPAVPVQPTAEPPVRRALGALTVTATPDCRLFEGRVALGNTPLVDVPMPSGLHSLRCVDAARRWRFINVVVPVGATSTVRLRDVVERTLSDS
jgi:serine/threonine-protein kinase